METKLLVTPEQLRAAASTFRTEAGTVKAQHDAMLSKVRSLSGVWSGDAATSFTTKFLALEKSMNTINRMINEHVNDLNVIADEYTSSESQATAIAEELPISTLE